MNTEQTIKNTFIYVENDVINLLFYEHWTKN